ncbi:hypothetical protein EJ04DRAFT_519165 [Polyplosphaeria fusca]|uniref:Uncharacterized protein n=1 Tax=Polyplosphaeria fusca TaxID=682080 RepID=A0A9P4RAK6_9PLEO|nr:hypothetical protein EJ04DRAFT_519165 [Polyplosphaeria fusca]
MDFSKQCLERKALRDEIASQARIVSGAKYPQGHDYDTVIGREFRNGQKHVVRVVVYIEKDSFAKHKVLLASPDYFADDVLGALVDVLEQLHSMLARQIKLKADGDTSLATQDSNRA